MHATDGGGGGAVAVATVATVAAVTVARCGARSSPFVSSSCNTLSTAAAPATTAAPAVDVPSALLPLPAPALAGSAAGARRLRCLQPVCCCAAVSSTFLDDWDQPKVMVPRCRSTLGTRAAAPAAVMVRRLRPGRKVVGV